MISHLSKQCLSSFEKHPENGIEVPPFTGSRSAGELSLESLSVPLKHLSTAEDVRIELDGVGHQGILHFPMMQSLLTFLSTNLHNNWKIP